MKDYKYVIFDLDGTLTDPAAGLVCGFEYALEKMGFPKEAPEALRRFIGPPLLDVWQKEYSLDYDGACEMIRLFREYYDVYGWWDNIPYPDIEKTLSSLREAGKRLLVATSKPERTAKRVLSLFGLDKYFDFIGGAETGNKRYTKEAVLSYVIDTCSVNLEEAIMVGDRFYDADGAKFCGMDSLGVLYGHGSPEEIKNAGFTYVAHGVEDIANLLTSR